MVFTCVLVWFADINEHGVAGVETLFQGYRVDGFDWHLHAPD